MPHVTSGDRGQAADLMAEVGDRYLLLIRENYLDDPRGAGLRDFLIRSLRRLACNGGGSCAIDLAYSDDWREAVVGLHYALIPLMPTIDLSDRVADRYQRDLLDPTVFLPPLAARPALLLLTALNRREAVLDFLASDRPADDAADAYAAALVGEELTRHGREPAAALRERVLARLRAESWHDASEFAASQERFRRAWRFWTEPDPR